MQLSRLNQFQSKIYKKIKIIIKALSFIFNNYLGAFKTKPERTILNLNQYTA